MSTFIENFHFLRPWLLLLLLPVAGLIGWGLRSTRHPPGITDLIAPHLLRHLLLDPARRRRQTPLYILAAFWTIGILAVSGPAWQRAPSPFQADDAGLVVVLKVTPHMLARDIQPSRLTRATQKIHDLLQYRADARTALVAYSGSSHLVMPFTRDPVILEHFAQALHPDIMPMPGDHPLAALEQAAALLRQADRPGSILLIADALPTDIEPALKRFHRQNPVPVLIYAMAAPPGVRVPAGGPPAPALDRTAMQRAAAALDAALITVTADESDVQRLVRTIARRNRSDSERQSRTTHWQDAGYWLLPLLLLIGLAFFRRGWEVDHETA